MLVKISTLVDNVNVVVGDPNNQANLKSTLANLSKATEESITTLQSVRQFSDTANDKVVVVSDQLGATLIEIQRLVNI
jgi:hypothetical protein